MKNAIAIRTLIVIAAITLYQQPAFSNRISNTSAAKRILNLKNNIPFGLELRQDKTPFEWHGDFDNDGITDSIYAVQITPKFQANSDITILNFWNFTMSQSDANKSLALLLKGSRNQTNYLLRNDFYFNSPIWRESELPVEVIEKTNPAHRYWQKQIDELKGDGFILGTEAGIDTLLYWDGSEFRLYFPNEAP